MADASNQTYATHRRFHPLYHFFTFPVLAINLVVQIVLAAGKPTSIGAWWNVVVAAALVTTALLVRVYALRNQDRIIGVEETLRLMRVLPAGLQPRIVELRNSQLIALRFSSDEELPELTRAVLAGECSSKDDIKKRIVSWRPDKRRI